MKPEQKDTGSPLGGNGFKTRVRSNFIPVGKPGEGTQSKPEEPSEDKAGDSIVSKQVDEAPKKEDVPAVKKEDNTGECKSIKSIDLPVVEKTNGSTELARLTPQGIPKPPNSKDNAKPAAPIEPVKAGPAAQTPTAQTTVASVKEPKPVSTPPKQPPRTPTQPAAHKTSPAKAVTPSPKVVSTPKRPAELTRTPKSPPTPKQTPPSTHPSNTQQRKSIGPLSPAKSSTSRSSSPFLPSPTRYSRPAPKKETPIGKTAPNVSPSTDRKVSTPKSVSAPAKTVITTKPIVKVSPAPKKVGATPKTTTPTPRGPSMRPRSAQSDVATPSPSRRIVSHPPRPATATSRPSPKLNRATSMQHLPRKPKADHPPVPAIPEQDYSHLPTFMRPTQASSAKVVARPSSAMEKRAVSGNFRG